MFSLVRHDLLIVRNSFLAAFSSFRDWLILLFALVLAAVLVRGFLVDITASGLHVSAWSLAAYFAVLGFMVHLYSAHRIAHFSEESPMAGFALRPGPRRAYHAALLTGVLVANDLPIALLYGYTAEPVLATALTGGWLALVSGAAAGAIWRRTVSWLRRTLQRRWLRRAPRRALPRDVGGHRASRLIAIYMRRQSIFGRSAAEAAALLGGAGLAIALVAFGASHLVSASEAMIVAAMLALGMMMVLSRLSAGLMRYLAFVGFQPLLPGIAPVPAMAVFLGSLTLSIAFLMPHWAGATAAAGAGMLLLFALIAYVRSLHYRIRSERAADFAIQMEAIAAAMLGFAFAPLAALFLLGRITFLHRQARHVTWALP